MKRKEAIKIIDMVIDKVDVEIHLINNSGSITINPTANSLMDVWVDGDLNEDIDRNQLLGLIDDLVNKEEHGEEIETITITHDM